MKWLSRCHVTRQLNNNKKSSGKDGDLKKRQAALISVAFLSLPRVLTMSANHDVRHLQLRNTEWVRGKKGS